MSRRQSRSVARGRAKSVTPRVRGKHYNLQEQDEHAAGAIIYAFYGRILEAALAMDYAYGIGTDVLDGESCPCRAVGAEEASGIARFHFPAARLR